MTYATQTDITSDLLGTRCPRCDADLCALPPQATFCPACGRRLRPEQSAWTAARAWADNLRRWRSPAVIALPTGLRAPVVVGYSNALWRLGWRYEHGRGTSRNVPEAMRCYRKSAGLGNVEAQSRLAPVAVLPIEPAPPALDVIA